MTKIILNVNENDCQLDLRIALKLLKALLGWLYRPKINRAICSHVNQRDPGG